MKLNARPLSIMLRHIAIVIHRRVEKLVDCIVEHDEIKIVVAIDLLDYDTGHVFEIDRYRIARRQRSVVCAGYVGFVFNLQRMKNKPLK